MASPYDDWKLIELNGTGNEEGALSSTAVEFELSEGAWEIWCTQNFYCQINAASGSGMGANPVATPANTIRQFAVPKTMYLVFKRIYVDGRYHVNKLAGPI
ncbi:MAG: hypothetical protein ACYTBJ_01205 [Planctomycetota bacterium]|jgi:hypothetical protein